MNPFDFKDSLDRIAAAVQAKVGAFLASKQRLYNVRDLAYRLQGHSDRSIKERARGIVIEANAMLGHQRSLEASAIKVMQSAKGIDAELSSPFWKQARTANISVLGTRAISMFASLVKRMKDLTLEGGGTLRAIDTHLSRLTTLERRTRSLADESQGKGIRAAAKAIGAGYTGALTGILKPLAGPLGFAAAAAAIFWLAPTVLPRFAKR